MPRFDPSRLLRQTDMSPRDRILATIQNRASSMTSSLSGEIAGRLAEVGQSIQSATQFAAARTDALLSSAPGAFTAMAALGNGNPALERISRGDLLNFRSGGEIAFDPQSVIPDSQEEGSFSDTKIFPSDLGSLDYRMELEFMEYKRPQLSGSPDLQMRFKICLPIPNTLIEGYGVGWNEGKYGPTVGTIINSIDAGQPNPTPGAVVGAARGAFQGTAAGAIQGVAGGLGGLGVEAEGISGAVDQMFGSIVNPHVALFFTGMSLREHQFSWAFAPRNSQDSTNLKEIYYRIKRSALPAFTPDAQFMTLEYPMMVRVRILTKGGKELYPFKMCVIPQISMNYASSGIPAFHGDGAPVLQQLNMTLKEIEYFTSDDIKNAQGADYSSFEADFIQNTPGIDAIEEYFGLVEGSANTLSQAVATNQQLQGLFGQGDEEVQ